MKKSSEHNSSAHVYVLCHGNWAKQLIQDTRTNFGLKAMYHIYPLTNEMALSDYKRKIRQDIKAYSNQSEILFLTDLMEGSTSLSALSLSLEFGKVPVITGLSLELLLAVDDYLSNKRKDLFEALLEAQNKTNIDLLEAFSLKEE